MEPIFWKKLPCVKEQRWEKWLERLVWSVKSWPHNWPSLYAWISVKGSVTPRGGQAGNLGALPHPHLQCRASPAASAFPMSLTSLCLSPLPLPEASISPMDHCTAYVNNKSQPSLALPSALQGLPEWSLQKINLTVLPSFWPLFPLKTHIKRNQSLDGSIPSKSPTCPVFSGFPVTLVAFFPYFFYLAVPGLSCCTRDLWSPSWHAGSLVAACGI